jgi:hypothetical protein
MYCTCRQTDCAMEWINKLEIFPASNFFAEGSKTTRIIYYEKVKGTEGHAMAQLVEALRYKPEVRGSIPDGVIGIFHWYNSSCRTMALGWTKPLTEMRTRNISWGVKATDAYSWQQYHLHGSIVLKSGSLNILEPSWPVEVCNGISSSSSSSSSSSVGPGG